jgi:hypothetical protein
MYASAEMYLEAVAGGERSFIRKVSEGKVKGKEVVGGMLYPLTDEEVKQCETCGAIQQDFDAQFKTLNRLSSEQLTAVRKRSSKEYPGAALIEVDPAMFVDTFTYRQLVFVRIRDFKHVGKYRMVEKMAKVKLCRNIYVALNAVNIAVEAPYIVTVTAKH